MGTTCCFFGHRDVFSSVEDFLYSKICYLIKNENVTEFLVGDHGDFDKAAASAVRKAKLNYTNVKLTLVRPYFSEELNTNKAFYKTLYDDIVIPSEAAQSHFKAAITNRNKWMINQSDFCIFYVFRENGGAYTALKYAEKQNKNIILFSK